MYRLRSIRGIQLASQSSLDKKERLSEPRYTCHMTLDQAFNVADP